MAAFGFQSEVLRVVDEESGLLEYRVSEQV